MSGAGRVLTAAWVLGAEIVGLAAQLLLLWIGAQFMLIEDGDEAESGRLLLWCLIGTLYVGCTMLWLNIDLRVRRADHPLQRRFVGGTAMRWISTIVTFSASLVGLTAAVTLILMRGNPDHLVFYELVAVWAMLVAWAIFHWGYARIYHSKYYRAKGDPPLAFPGTAEPRIVDFVYFAFTIGTSFASSDVSVTDTRMRWTVVWHNTFSFFFNALIIVLTMNTIAGGFQGS